MSKNLHCPILKLDMVSKHLFILMKGISSSNTGMLWTLRWQWLKSDMKPINIIKKQKTYYKEVIKAISVLLITQNMGKWEKIRICSTPHLKPKPKEARKYWGNKNWYPVNDHRWLLHVPIHQLFLLLFCAKALEENRYDLMERVLGWNKGTNLRYFPPWREILLSHQRAVLPRDYLSRDSEYKAPGQSHTWMRDKASCSHRQRYSWCKTDCPFMALLGLMDFVIPITRTHGQLFWFRSKAKTIQCCLHQQPHIDMQECNSRPSIQNTSS